MTLFISLHLLLPRLPFLYSSFPLLSSLSLLLSTCFTPSVLAQSLIVPDGTLGAEQSQVQQNVDINGLPSELIQDGATRGPNLFHSFSEFNVDAGRGAYFANPAGIANILSRVTGNNASNILGTLGVRGAADLFLMNPNGIIFGPNSSLDVNGSFAAVTADGIAFGEQGIFSATAPDLPSPLLTVDPSAFFFNQIPVGNIASRAATLQVPNGENLLLLGGDVTIAGGNLNGLGGRIDIGSVGGVGTVTLNPDRSLNFPETLGRSDVTFSDEVLVDVSLDSGGDIAVTGRNITISGSELRSGIRAGMGASGSQAGDIVLNALSSVRVVDDGAVVNQVSGLATGNSGDIDIDISMLEMVNGASLSTTVFGQGNGGNIIVNASDRISLDHSDIFSDIGLLGMGDGGDITITTARLKLLNEARLATSTSTASQGNAGDIAIDVSDQATFDNAFISSSLGLLGTGDGGNIEITAATLDLRNGTILAATTSGEGNGGNIIMNVSDALTFNDGASISSRADSTSVGNGGDIEIRVRTIEASSLGLPNKTSLITSTSGEGNAGSILIDVEDSATFNNTLLSSRTNSSDETGNGGNVEIRAETLELLNGTQVTTSTSGEGNAGDIIVDVTDGATFSDGFIDSSVNFQGTGNGGNIEITARTLDLVNETQFTAGTFGEGNGGDIIIDVSDRATFKDALIRSDVAFEAIGNGGDIDIGARTVELFNETFLVTGTNGEGRAGNILIDASDRVSLVSDGFLASGVGVEGVGTGGNIDIRTSTLELRDRSEVSASTVGEGNAGQVTIDVLTRIALAGESAITTVVSRDAQGNSNQITLRTPQLILDENSQILASTSGIGSAGAIDISEADTVQLDNNSRISTEVNEGATATQPSSISIDTRLLELSNGAEITASTAGDGNAGDVSVTNAEQIVLSNGAIATTVEATGVGAGGSIDLETGVLTMGNGSQIASSTEGQGGAGDITIDALTQIALMGESNESKITTAVEAGAEGNAGQIVLRTPRLTLDDRAQVLAATSGTGNPGAISIVEADAVQLDNSSISTVINGGALASQTSSIAIDTRSLELGNRANITASTAGEGGAGNITVTNAEQVLLSNGAIVSTVEKTGNGDGGRIAMDTGTLLLANGSRMISSTSGRGDAGVIIIDAATQVTLTGESEISTLADRGAQGNAGPITMQAPELIIVNGSGIIATTSSSGNAGTITIAGADTIQLDNGEISTAIRQGGIAPQPSSIAIDTRSLELSNRAAITASTAGEGRAGDISIDAAQMSLSDGVIATTVSPTGSGAGGTITVNTAELEMGDRSLIRSSTAGQGNAGRIVIEAATAITLNEGSEITTDVEAEAIGNAERIVLRTPTLLLTENSAISATTASEGNPGIIRVVGAEEIFLNNSRISTTISEEATAETPGSINLQTQQLLLTNGSDITATTEGNGDAGRIRLQNLDTLDLNNSRLSSAITQTGTADNPGSIIVDARSLQLRNGADINASTDGQGSAGSIRIANADFVGLDDSQISTAVEANATATEPGTIVIAAELIQLTNGGQIRASTEGNGDAGQIEVMAGELEMGDRSAILSRSTTDPSTASESVRAMARRTPNSRAGNVTTANAGDITIVLGDTLSLEDSVISTESQAFAGGKIQIMANAVRLRGDSDITTNVLNGRAGAGNITLIADSILAFDDSDILAFAADGQGGDIIIDTMAFLSEGFTLASLNADPEKLDGNDRVDINATGAFSGTVVLPDVSFIQNSLNNLPENVIDTESLIAKSCVVQSEDGTSTFIVTGPGGLREQPGDSGASSYPTGDVQSIPDESSHNNQDWQIGDLIIEPQGVYQLPNGELILTHQCR